MHAVDCIIKARRPWEYRLHAVRKTGHINSSTHRKDFHRHHFGVGIELHLHHRFAADDPVAEERTGFRRIPSSPTMAISTMDPSCITVIINTNSAIQGENIAHRLIRRVEGVLHLDRNRSEVRTETLEVGPRQAREQLVLGPGVSRRTDCVCTVHHVGLQTQKASVSLGVDIA